MVDSVSINNNMTIFYDYGQHTVLGKLLEVDIQIFLSKYSTRIFDDHGLDNYMIIKHSCYGKRLLRTPIINT